MELADIQPLQQCTWLNTPQPFTISRAWRSPAAGPITVVCPRWSQQNTTSLSRIKLQDFLTLKQVAALWGRQQLGQILLSIAYRCKMQGNVVLCYSPWAELLCWMLYLSPPIGRPDRAPQNSTATHSPELHWDIERLHAVWLLHGWERLWMEFIHCNQNPTSTGRKFKCMWNSLSKKLAKAAYFSCLTRSYAIKWLITHGTVWGVKD